MSSAKTFGARENLVRAVIQYLAAERLPDEDPYGSASLEYAANYVDVAARDLFRAVDVSDREDRPIGW